MDGDEEVAGWFAVGSCFALSGEAHFLAVDDAGGDAHRDRAGAPDGAGAVARGARVLDDVAGAAAVGAWAGHAEGAGVLADVAGAVALFALFDVAGFGSGAVACGAWGVAGEFDGEGGAFGGFAEVERYFRLDVRPPRRPSVPASSAAAVKEATEEITKAAFSSLSSTPGSSEDVGEVGEVEVALPRLAKPSRKAGTSCPSESAAEAAGAHHRFELVVFFAFFFVADDVVRFCHLLKLLLGGFVAGVGVGVVFACELAVCLLNVSCGRVFGDAEVAVVVLVGPLLLHSHLAPSFLG